MAYDKAFLVELYRKMLLIRQFEERVKYLFLEGIMPGTIHQYQGQEAIAVGVCSALEANDVITSTHRPHGHALAKGLTVESLMHELFGKTTGCCGGKGGSMHVGDLEKGMVPAIAIVAGGVPIATGMALAFKYRKEPRVAVSFMGDGAVNEGAFHEAVNMGAIWSLPVVYVIENNLYSASTPIFEMVRLKRLSDRAAGYGIPGVTVDGNDVLEVFEAARAGRRARPRGEGPTLARVHHLPHHRPLTTRPLQLPTRGRAEGGSREGTAAAVPGIPAGRRVDGRGRARRDSRRDRRRNRTRRAVGAWRRRTRSRKRRWRMCLSEKAGELWLK